MKLKDETLEPIFKLGVVEVDQQSDLHTSQLHVRQQMTRFERSSSVILRGPYLP